MKSRVAQKRYVGPLAWGLGVLAFASMSGRPAVAESTLTPVGACAFGTFCEVMTAEMCELLGGVYLGHGTICPTTAFPVEPGNNGGVATVGEPVYLFSGELFQTVVDLRIRGRGPDFAWGRKYRSRIGGSSPIGYGWDFSYDIRLGVINGPSPGEVTDLQFGPDKQTLSWTPPQDPGGPIQSLRYCPRRSTNPADFSNATILDAYGKAPETQEAAVPASGQMFSYLVTAKNQHGEGSAGTRSNGTPRVVVPCGGSSLVLFDGTGRRDVYQAQPGGTWEASEFFQVFTVNPDGSYALRFPDLSVWTFHGFDGSPVQGRIESMADRNGNALHFFYDALGRLASISDTLNRLITISWNPQGLIASVTDFTGRQVLYGYYDGVEPGGSFADLKSVTTPAVIGTPTGNDFPLGKTTVYTYSTGHSDDRLNHNLLTITDSKGQTYLVNEYDPTPNSADLNFDRIRRQTWGNPGDVLDFVYTAMVPSPANGYAVVKAVVNDRVGNVSEYQFDLRNRCTTIRNYTGRADPDLPTDIDGGFNLPVGPLRPDDPPYFETRYEWNNDALPLRIVNPDLGEKTFVYDATNPNRRSQGNIVQQCRLAGPLGGDQFQICESMEYDPAIHHGSNFPTRVVDGRGAQTLHAYDLRGNRTTTVHRIPSIVEDFEYDAFGQLSAHVLPDNGSGSRRRDEYHYYAGGPQNGYLSQEVLDASNLALTTNYEYDAVGNIAREIDPRGHDSLFVYNQLDQVVRATTREVQNGSGIRYREDKYYDANDNVVREDIANYDEEGVLQPNAAYSQLYEYDILDELTRSCGEAGDVSLSPVILSCSAIAPAELALFTVTEFVYDPNRQQTLARYGTAVNGSQPANTLRTLYDERGLTFRETRAEGDPAQSTTQQDYDGDFGLRRVARGLEASPRVTLYQRDGYGRLMRETDPMGNVTLFHYDPNGNLSSSRHEGELTDMPGAGANVRLAETTYVWDAMDRPLRVETQYFDPVSQSPLPGGQQLGLVKTAVEYSGNSQIVRTIDDNLHDLVTTYDTANREKTSTDALGNRVTYTYDANSNVTQTVELEKSDLGSPDASYTTNYVFDNLDRRIRRTDAIGNILNYGYDSWGNMTRFTDALTRQRRHRFDGLGRQVLTVHDMDGDGADPVDLTDIVTLEAWDASGRLLSRTDDNGTTTSYQYDPLDRMVATIYPDATQETSVYDAHDNETSRTDPNGSFMTQTYDSNGRLSGRNIVPGPGVSSDTTFELYRYDGMSRLVRAEDNDSVLTYTYDSLANTRSETVLGRTTAVDYDGIGNRVRTVYPGGRTVTATYDALERMKTIGDTAGLLATYFYRGPRRVERRDHRNGTRTAYAYDGVLPNPPGDFGRRRIIGTTHTRIAGGTIIDARTYLWDRNQNKTRRVDTRTGGPRFTHNYSYDAVNRLVHATVTNAVPTVVRDIDFVLDGVANRLSVTGMPDPGLYTRDANGPEPADAGMNQYTNTPFDARQYDRNGNLTAITPNGGPITSLLYDYRNHMVDYFEGGTGRHHVFRYDALGRRVVKIADVNGPAVETRYFRDGRHVVEEEDGVGATVATYVWGRSIDETLQMERGGSQFFYHADDLSSVMALTDLAGSVVERYDYQDFGVPEFRDATGNVVQPITSSAFGNPFLFHGRRYDGETSWYCHRNRYRDPRSGEWTTRDVLGTWGDSANLGDANGFVGNNPWTYTDPSGRKTKPETETEKVLEWIWEIFTKAMAELGAARKQLEEAEKYAEDNKGSIQSKDKVAEAKKRLRDAEKWWDVWAGAVKRVETAVQEEKPEKLRKALEKAAKQLDDFIGEGDIQDKDGAVEPATEEGRKAREAYKKWKEEKGKGKGCEWEEMEQLEKWKKAIEGANKHLRNYDDHKIVRAGRPNTGNPGKPKDKPKAESKKTTPITGDKPKKTCPK